MKLKRYAFFTLLSLISFQLSAQELVFESRQDLFAHPRQEAYFGYPFLPLDYNSDGLTDFIGATFNDQLLYKGKADGTYEVLDIYQGFAELPAKVMDYDNDGDDDVIMSRYINLYAEADSFTFFNPDLNFSDDIVEVADFDGNGFNDLLTVRSQAFENGTLTIHFNEGDDTFTAVTIQNDYDYAAVAAGDIDNDGDQDFVALLEFESSPAVVFLNEGERNFTALEIQTSLDLTRNSIDLVDLDDDGDLDLVTQGFFDDIYIFENTDTFQTVTNYEQIPAVEVVFSRLADMDNDGDQDIITITGTDTEFKIQYALSNGGFDYGTLKEVASFSAPSIFIYPNVNYLKNNVLTYDFDGDEKLDLIYVDGFSSESKVILLRNATEITAIPDLRQPRIDLAVFPNPAANELRIKAGTNVFHDLTYFLISADGKLIKQGTTRDQVIDISNLAPGDYRVLLRESGISEPTVYYAHFVKASQE